MSENWRNLPAPAAEADIGEELTCDICVIGAGFAGTAAARAASEAGAKVLVLEAQHEKGYNAFGQDMGHCNSRFLAGRGVPKVDPIELFNDMMLRAGGRANPELVMCYAQTCGEAFDWLTDVCSEEELSHLQVRFWPTAGQAQMTLHGQHFYVGTAIFPGMRGTGDEGFGEIIEPSVTTVLRRNQKKAEALGAVIRFGTPALQLTQEADGSVDGVIARSGSSCIRVRAKAVILAGGDFGGNAAMCRELCTDISDRIGDGKMLSFGRDGSSIRMGLRAGGMLEPRPLATMGGSAGIVKGITYTFHDLLLDEHGRRYMNECFGDPVTTGCAGVQYRVCRKYSVFDSNIMDHLKMAPPCHTGFPSGSEPECARIRYMMECAMAAGPAGADTTRKNAPGAASKGGGRLYAAKDPETLASYLSEDSVFREEFQSSFRRYQEICRSGRDDDFGKDPRLLQELKGPWFFAEEVMPEQPGFFLVTVGGLITDGRQQVLNEERAPIPGLYASGNSCGRRFGPQYSTPIAGVSLGMAMTLGRAVGQNAAHDVIRKK